MGYGLPSKQTVNAVEGRLQARNVRVGCRLWMLDGERTVQTTVAAVATARAREVVDVVTDHVSFTVAPDQMLGTPDGWVHARDATGTVLADGSIRAIGPDQVAQLITRLDDQPCPTQLPRLRPGAANVPFLSELAQVVGARFTPRTNGLASHLVVVDSWTSRDTFKAERHPLQLRESCWTQVHEARLRTSVNKPFTLYSYRLDPHPGFLVNGHLVRQPW